MERDVWEALDLDEGFESQVNIIFLNKTISFILF